MLRLVADLSVADKIAPDGRISVQELATSCAVLPDPLLRVLRALAAFGVFRVAPDGTIAHTPRSRLLRTDTPNSLHHSARFWTALVSWNAWGRLDAAMTGQVPHEAAWNQDRFAYLRAHPDEARAFDAMMANLPENRHAAIAGGYDFSNARLIADIYMLIRVLHDWPDEDCLRILRACRAAMGKDALLLLGEQILEPDPTRGQPMGYLIDIQMMAMFGHARQRTEAEFAGLFAASGFTLRRVIATASPVSIVEAAPI